MGINTIFLSPHHDDICFSLAGTVLAYGGGTLINIFSRSDYVALPFEATLKILSNQTDFKSSSFSKKSDLVSELRRLEDEEFCHHTGLKRHDLNLNDAALRGDDPFTHQDAEIINESKEVGQAMLPILEQILNAHGNQSPTNLYTPIGIGGHRDHLSCLMAVLELPIRIKQRLNMVFYEDLHYASNPKFRSEGLKRFSTLAADKNLAKLPLRLSPADLRKKMSLVELYKSQHDYPPMQGEYIPADSNRWGPHEGIWIEL